ncbi:ubiquitin-related domain-containing protein [Cladochytrium replicatum]|nr:ubiquitin-related domain-containing protein [Cladochytrium replicatum]
MPTDREQLLEFGFPAAKVDRALRATGNAGLQVAIDWLEEHADDPDVEESTESTANAGSAPSGSKDEEDGEIAPEDANAQSLRCDDCGKLFRDAAKAEFHAMKSGHVNFSESREAIKPLTPEEKAAKLVELQERLKQKREEKRLREIQEEREKEKVRRKSGQEMSAIKDKMEQLEMKKILEQQKREKEQEKAAKERIKLLLEQDKRERAEKREREKLAAQGITPAQPAPKPVVATPVTSSTKEYTEARLQIRAPSGPITHTFGASDTLEKVYQHCADILATTPTSFKLLTTFPRKVLDERSKTLQELGLAPSAALMLQM